MATVFLSYPARDITDEDRQLIWDAMMANYDAVNNEHNTYTTTHDNLWSDSLYYLGESLQYIDKADVVLLHPDWLKEIGCIKEAEAAGFYNKKVVYLDELRWDLIYWISVEVKKPTVRAKIIKLCDEHCIWTKEFFAKIYFSVFEDVNGIGPVTIRTIKDLQKKIREGK